MYADLGLPSFTIFLASEAKSFGGFGLVGGGITIPYHMINLGQTLPRAVFTNDYHRGEGLTIELGIMHQVAGWAGL